MYVASGKLTPCASHSLLNVYMSACCHGCVHPVQVTLGVWYPSNLTLTAADDTLNSVLPINAAPSTPSCASYQSTALRLTATFSNGAAGPANALVDADVTSLVTFSSNDTNVAQVFGSMVKVREQR